MKHILFVLNVPSFYKLNLLDRLTPYFKITGLFLGTTHQVLLGDTFNSVKYTQIFLSDNDTDKKFLGLKRIPGILKNIYQLKPDYIVYCGWDNIDMVVASFFTKRKKNCLVCESSIIESQTTGIKGYIKRLIVSRFSKSFPSGKPHLELLKKLKFRGTSFITGSVGVNTPFKRIGIATKEQQPFKFIYIGRLIEIKNVDLLLDVFNQTGKNLTIVGDGPLMSELKSRAKNNITITGHASREEINELLLEHHCLVLPSKSETWGLVVEEALQCGLPVIASNKVGSAEDLIRDYKSGIIFSYDDKLELLTALDEMEGNYNYYRDNALKIDFHHRECEYINAFVRAFNQ